MTSSILMSKRYQAFILFEDKKLKKEKAGKIDKFKALIHHINNRKNKNKWKEFLK